MQEVAHPLRWPVYVRSSAGGSSSRSLWLADSDVSALECVQVLQSPSLNNAQNRGVRHKRRYSLATSCRSATREGWKINQAIKK